MMFGWSIFAISSYSCRNLIERGFAAVIRHLAQYFQNDRRISRDLASQVHRRHLVHRNAPLKFEALELRQAGREILLLDEESTGTG